MAQVLEKAPPGEKSATATTTKAATRRRRGSLGDRIAFGVLILAAFIWVLPLLWAIDTALKPEFETVSIPVTWLSSHFTLAAFSKVLGTGSLLQWFWNSILTSAIITVASVVLASLVAYSVSRIPFRGRWIVFWFIIAGLMVPTEALIVPLFTEMNSFNLVNTYWGIILPQIVSPIGVFIFKQFFDGIPGELEEAAIIDGASRLRIYWQIWMPLSRPAIAAVAIFAFVASWNNFLWPFIIVTSTPMMTLTVGLTTVQSAYGIHYAQIMAAAVLSGLPLVVAFLFLQRQFVQGIAGTGIKG